MNKQDLRALAASALSSGVQVRRLETGASNRLRSKDWSKILQSPTKVDVRALKEPRKVDPIEQRIIRTDHAGREYVFNGYGEAL